MSYTRNFKGTSLGKPPIRGAFQSISNRITRKWSIWVGILALCLATAGIVVAYADTQVRRQEADSNQSKIAVESKNNVGSKAVIARQDTPQAGGTPIISEFRLRGPNGANDEYIEIYNSSDTALTVAASSGTGFGIAASDGVLRCTIPNATVIPARGHFLCTNSTGYTYSNYPAGNGTTATGDATYAVEHPRQRWYCPVQ